MPSSAFPELAPFVEALSSSSVVAGAAVVGSQSSGRADDASDLDVFVFVLPDCEDAVLLLRQSLLERLADPTRFQSLQQTGHPYADAWTLTGANIVLDLMFWTTAWAEDELDWRLIRYERQIGEASTAFWRSIRDGVPLLDPTGWLEALQTRARSPYPEELRRKVLDDSRSLLGRTNVFSFFHQLSNAIRRRDRVAVNHRTAKWVATYFDALFAANRVLRLVAFARDECAHVPASLEGDLDTLFDLTTSLDSGVEPLLDKMLDDLDTVIAATAQASPRSHAAAGLEESE